MKARPGTALRAARALATRRREQPPPPPAREIGLWDKYGEEASLLVSWFDFSPADVVASRRLHIAFPDPLDIRSVTWFIPDFQHAYYGGIYTILRFADYFSRVKGITNQFVVVGSMDPRTIAERIESAFPGLRGSIVRRIGSLDRLHELEETDVAIATLWSSAYFLLRFNATRRKFYFVQDYEPLFYPAGSTFAQVDATYRFGFYGLANTPAIEQIYEEQYGGVAEHFVPCVDTTLFHPQGRQARADGRWMVFFYGRPGHPRNGFELGVGAMKKLKARLGERVRIVSAGATWQPVEFGLDGIVENLGLLGYTETAELYRQCDAGLAMMFTRHPSYLPFEMMASGCLVVSNHNPATAWLLKDGVNCLLSETSATCLAEVMERGLQEGAQRARITANAAREIQVFHGDWPGQIEKIHRFMGDPRHAG